MVQIAAAKKPEDGAELVLSADSSGTDSDVESTRRRGSRQRSSSKKGSEGVEAARPRRITGKRSKATKLAGASRGEPQTDTAVESAVEGAEGANEQNEDDSHFRIILQL
jgi:hypothetical protein